MTDYNNMKWIGKLADLVLWKPCNFGCKPEMIIKGGYIAYAQIGDANASIPTPEPVYMRKMYGSYGINSAKASYAFVSKRSMNENIIQTYGLNKQIYSINNVRNINKLNMKYNNYLPNIKVDSETYRVIIDDEIITCLPSTVLPLAQRYFSC